MFYFYANHLLMVAHSLYICSHSTDHISHYLPLLLYLFWLQIFKSVYPGSFIQLKTNLFLIFQFNKSFVFNPCIIAKLIDDAAIRSVHRWTQYDVIYQTSGSSVDFCSSPSSFLVRKCWNKLKYIFIFRLNDPHDAVTMGSAHARIHFLLLFFSVMSSQPFAHTLLLFVELLTVAAWM